MTSNTKILTNIINDCLPHTTVTTNTLINLIGDCLMHISQNIPTDNIELIRGDLKFSVTIYINTKTEPESEILGGLENVIEKMDFTKKYLLSIADRYRSQTGKQNLTNKTIHDFKKILSSVPDNLSKGDRKILIEVSNVVIESIIKLQTMDKETQQFDTAMTNTHTELKTIKTINELYL